MRPNNSNNNNNNKDKTKQRRTLTKSKLKTIKPGTFNINLNVIERHEKCKLLEIFLKNKQTGTKREEKENIKHNETEQHKKQTRIIEQKGNRQAIIIGVFNKTET